MDDLADRLQEKAPEILAVRDRFIKSGLSARGADRDATQALITKLYGMAGAPPPKDFVWFASPQEAIVAASLIYESASAVQSAIRGGAGLYPSQSTLYLRLNQLLTQLDDAPGRSDPMRVLLLHDYIGNTPADWRAGVRDWQNPWDEDLRITKYGGENIFLEVPMAADQIANFALRSLVANARDPRHRLQLWKAVSAEGRHQLKGRLKESWDYYAESLFSAAMSNEGEAVQRQINFAREATRHAITPQFAARHAAVAAAMQLFQPQSSNTSKSTETDAPAESIDLQLISQVVECGCWWWPFAEACVISEPPERLSVDERWRLHDDNEMAVRYPNGWGLWAIHGAVVPEKVVKRQFDPGDIDQEWNVEVKRVMLDLYGAARYLQDSGAKEIHRDEFGVLYRKPMQHDEALVMVRVTNSTPEPDGTYKQYFLRVPPDIRTAKQAVAWTFNVDENDYRPDRET